MEHMIMGFDIEDYYSRVPFIHGIHADTRNLRKNGDGTFSGQIKFSMEDVEYVWCYILEAYLTPYLGEIA